MLQWFADNVEGLLAILTIAAAAISILVKAGAIQKARGDTLTQVIEDSAGAVTRTVKILRKQKQQEARKQGKEITEDDVKLSDLEIAEAIAKGLKGESRERAVKTGLKSVLQAVNDGAAKFDPKKAVRGAGRRFLSVLKARFSDRNPG